MLNKDSFTHSDTLSPDDDTMTGQDDILTGRYDTLTAGVCCTYRVHGYDGTGTHGHQESE